MNRTLWIAPLLLLLLSGCGRLNFDAGPLLYAAGLTPDAISPNADGDADVTEITYSLRRAAHVSIYFEDEAGTRTYFRQDRRRAAGDYSVLWGGAVDERQIIEIDGGTVEVLSRVLPDGPYRWVIEAVEEGREPVRAEGTITLTNADTETPILNNFAVVPEVFRPNQDGLRDDWVSISYYLTKDADQVLVYLVDPADEDLRYFIAEEPGVIEPEERGYHEYRYEGGVDLNAEPPPDGEYAIIGEVRDRAGNASRVSQPLTIEEGGKPRADVVQGEIDWQDEMNRVVLIQLGEKLCFSAVVANESTVPIRTSGPWPGQEYRFRENYNTLADELAERSWGQQSGVWRFGINYDTTGLDFPYRWAVGRQEDLERRVINGQEQWYLMPGMRGEVSGCIIIDEEPPTGTQIWWGGLIHQGVEVANNDIDRITVDVGAP
ncbi:MAG: hypothetical protein H6642_13020 [Caldilineaceae bacterium]|nr:hypothetical protein [Caldilineaceae bacterium]